MLYRFLSNLGSNDADACNDACKTHIDYRECSAGNEVDLPEGAANWLKAKYAALIEPVSK
ncbi:MAG: hypothetical protein IAF94_21000 [Pirellulaceae bacterium]|nr:hypothetical protein [Pirellulaceae bacterium]